MAKRRLKKKIPRAKLPTTTLDSISVPTNILETEAKEEELNVNTWEDFAEIRDRKPVIPKDELYREVVAYSMDGIPIDTYPSCGEAGKSFGISRSVVSAVCTGRQLYYHGQMGKKTSYIFLYRGEDIEERLELIEKDKYLRPFKNNHKAVRVYSLGGKLIGESPTVTQVAKIYNTTTYIVTNCCKGQHRFYYKDKIFLYADDESIKERVKLVKQELYRISKKRPKYREVDEYSLDGIFIKAFPSASAAAREYNCHVSNIVRCCQGIHAHGTTLQCKGKVFLWVGDSISRRLELIEQVKQEKSWYSKRLESLGNSI